MLPDDAHQNVPTDKEVVENYKKPTPRFDPSKKVRRYRPGFRIIDKSHRFWYNKDSLWNNQHDFYILIQ